MRIKKYRGLNDPQKKKTERNSSYSRRFRFSAILLAFLMVFQYTVVGMGVTVWAEDGSSTEVAESADADAEAKAKEAAEQKAKEEAEAKAQAEAEAQAAAEAKAADEAKAAEEKAAAEAKAAEEEVNQSREDSTSVSDAEDVHVVFLADIKILNPFSIPGLGHCGFDNGEAFRKFNVIGDIVRTVADRSP